MICFRKSLLHLLLPVVLTGCMSGPNFSARWTGRSEKAWRDAFLAARMAEQKGDLMRASAAYEELLQKHPQKADAHHRLGILCQKSGRTEEAVQHLTRAHQIAPMDIEVLCDLGYIHYLQNRPKDAIATLQKAQQINPGHERTQANLAVALIAMDQVPSAVALLRQNMGEAPAATMVGFALAQRGELDQAKKYFSQALDADASNQPAAEALVQIEEMLNAQQKPSEQPAETASTSGVAATGQMAVLPFEVISEGVVTRPSPTAVTDRSPIAAVRDSATVLPAAATSASAGRVEQTAASAPAAADQHSEGNLPSLKVPSSSPSPSTNPLLPATAKPGAEKKIESPLITVRESAPRDNAKLRGTSSEGLTLPPVESQSSWRPSRQKSSLKHPDSGEGLHFSNRLPSGESRDVHVWRSTSSRISKVGFSEPDVSDDESVEFAEAELLPSVDAFGSAGTDEPADVAPVFTGSRKAGSLLVAQERHQRGKLATTDSGSRTAQKSGDAAGSAANSQAIPVQAPATGGAQTLPALPARLRTAASVTQPTAASLTAAASVPASPAPSPAAAPASTTTPQRAAVGTVGGLPLAFLRAMYVQMNEEQKVTFWKDLRKLPGAVTDAELSAYRELARSTENLPRVEAAITMLAVFHEDKLAAELLSNLEKSPDPVVRQSASTAESMLQIRLSEQGTK